MTPGHSEIPTPHNDKDDESFLTVTIRKQRKWLILAASGLVIVAVVATVASTSSATDETSQSAAISQPPTAAPASPSTAPTTAPASPSHAPTTSPWSPVVGGDDGNATVYQNNSVGTTSNTTLHHEVITSKPVAEGAAFNHSTTTTTTSPPESTTASPSPSATTTTPPPPPRPSPQPSPAPTTAPPKLLSYTDTKFDWLDIRNWQGDNEISATSFATSAFKPDRIHVSTFGRPFEKSPVLRTTPGWKGNRALLIEWTSYAGSDTNIWLLPTSLTSQFHTTAWPKCGEYDIFEMFNGDAAIGHKGTTNLWFNGGLEGFGQSTLHMSTTKCFAPFYPNGMNRPSSTSQSAQWHTAYGAKNAMAVVFGTDGNGKFIQQIQNPKIVLGPNSTVDIETDGANAAAKIYTNDNLYWGVKPVGGCADGYDGGSPGFPFMTDDFRLILQEQYQGTFDVTNFKVFVKN